MSFLGMEAALRVKGSKLMRLEQLVEWSKLKKLLGKLGRSGYGPGGYEAIKLLKALVLQSWYSLSDPKLEEALRVRLDFMLFTGFESEVPDETTICRFRNLLIDLQLWEKLFKEINRQLSERGLSLMPASSAIVDATIIESAARAGKETEGIVVDREEGSDAEVVMGETKLSCDPDARWLKKGKKSYFGYKAFIATDEVNGFIGHVEVLPANVSEVSALDKAICGLKPRRVYADKGYSSFDNREMLKSKGIKNGIMYKATRNKELSKWQKLFNLLVSKRRYIVEQAFGTLKRRFNMTRATYMTLEKVKAEVQMKAIAFNLLKAVNLVQYST